MTTDLRDRLRDMIDLLVVSLDDEIDAEALARRAHLSRFHFDRIVGGALGEPPAAFRRRLLLERAAWQLSRSRMSVTNAAFAAGYEAPESFTRAFVRAFGMPPSRFRDAQRDFRIDAPNGVHFHPPAGLWRDVPGQRSASVNELVARMVEHDHAVVGRLLDAAFELDDTDLDRVVRPGNVVLEFDGPETTVREMLAALVWTKEVWVAAVEGIPTPPRGPDDLASLRRRHEVAGQAFIELVHRTDRAGDWESTFIDALCDPPQQFTLGSVVAHILTFSAHRRTVLARVVTELGIDTVGSGCPIDWEIATPAWGSRGPTIPDGDLKARRPAATKRRR